MSAAAKMTLMLVLTFASTACGYSLLLAGDGDRGRVAVPMAGNETPFTYLAGPLTGAIRTTLGSYGFDLASAEGAPVLSVTIEAVGDGPGMVSAKGDTLVPADVEWTLVAKYSLVAPDGAEIIPETRAEARVRSLATGGVIGEEAGGGRARSEAMDRIAREIALRVVGALRQ